MLPNLATLVLSPGNVLVRCPECASHFRKAMPTGCLNCEEGKRKRDEEEKKKDDCSCKKECACDEEEDASGPGFFAGTTGDEQDAPFTSLGNSSEPGFRSLGADDEDEPLPRLGMPSQEELEEMERTRGYMPSLAEMDARGEQPKFRAA